MPLWRRRLRAAGIDLPDDYARADIDDTTADRVLGAFALFDTPRPVR